MPLSRRDFVHRSAITGAGIALAGAVDVLATAPGALAAGGPAHHGDDHDHGHDHGHGHHPELGYGPLVADPAGLLALPAGFAYRIVTRTGTTTLDSGRPPRPTTTAPPPSRASAAPRCWSTTTRSAAR